MLNSDFVSRQNWQHIICKCGLKATSCGVRTLMMRRRYAKTLVLLCLKGLHLLPKVRLKLISEVMDKKNFDFTNDTNIKFSPSVEARKMDLRIKEAYYLPVLTSDRIKTLHWHVENLDTPPIEQPLPLDEPPVLPDCYCELCGTEAHQKCGHCKSVRYCSPSHQQNDWDHHKRLCKKDGQSFV